MNEAAVAAHVEIDRLQRAYADVVNRRAWDELGELFTPDAIVELDLVSRPSRRLVGPASLGTFIGTAVERFSFFEFVILNSHIELPAPHRPDHARGRIFMCELRQNDGETQRNDAFGCYQDAYERVDGRWWFAHRRYRSMAQFPAGTVFPLPAMPPVVI